ncbi:hypothetical protein BGZ98_009391 [Dissophora globulifera]|nr:hypothetical protein BGZ98_009391 [Dissophora globulifera]
MVLRALLITLTPQIIIEVLPLLLATAIYELDIVLFLFFEGHPRPAPPSPSSSLESIAPIIPWTISREPKTYLGSLTAWICGVVCLISEFTLELVLAVLRGHKQQPRENGCISAAPTKEEARRQHCQLQELQREQQQQQEWQEQWQQPCSAEFEVLSEVMFSDKTVLHSTNVSTENKAVDEDESSDGTLITEIHDDLAADEHFSCKLAQEDPFGTTIHGTDDINLIPSKLFVEEPEKSNNVTSEAGIIMQEQPQEICYVACHVEATEHDVTTALAPFETFKSVKPSSEPHLAASPSLIDTKDLSSIAAVSPREPKSIESLFLTLQSNNADKGALSSQVHSLPILFKTMDLFTTAAAAAPNREKSASLNSDIVMRPVLSPLYTAFTTHQDPPFLDWTSALPLSPSSTSSSLPGSPVMKIAQAVEFVRSSSDSRRNSVCSSQCDSICGSSNYNNSIGGYESDHAETTSVPVLTESVKAEQDGSDIKVDELKKKKKKKSSKKKNKKKSKSTLTATDITDTTTADAAGSATRLPALTENESESEDEDNTGSRAVMENPR